MALKAILLIACNTELRTADCVVFAEAEDKIALPELLRGGNFTRGKRRFSFKTIQNVQAAKMYARLRSVIYCIHCIFFLYSGLNV